MKLVIDEKKCTAHNLKLEEVLCMLVCKSCDNIYGLIADMQNRELLSKRNDTPFPTPHWDDELSAVLLESEDNIPSKERCEALAEKLRALFPKGIKTGNAAWRGNKREVGLRLQKFFKLYGAKWTDDEIIDATQRYINHFNGNYTFMRILKYFILKFEDKVDEEGNGYREEVSELATWLENDTEVDNTDWLTEMR